MNIVETKERKRRLLKSLLNLWERSVRATHDFLDKRTIEEIKRFVPNIISGVQHLIVAFDGDTPLGFIGVENHEIDMLFVDDVQRGKGIGSALLEYALKEFDVNEVTVNEENHYAHEFYLRKGFKDVERKDRDEQGNCFPIIIMKR